MENLDAESFQERFWSKVDIRSDNDCWEWLASRTEHGYGRFRIGGRSGKTHKAPRISFFLTHGFLPENALHTCDNPPCVNPNHLFDGTTADNIHDMYRKGRANHTFKLSQKDIDEILVKIKKGNTHAKIAKEYDVHKVTIGRLKKKYDVQVDKIKIKRFCNICNIEIKVLRKGKCASCYMKQYRQSLKQYDGRPDSSS